jgi:hypothetical protein
MSNLQPRTPNEKSYHVRLANTSALADSPIPQVRVIAAALGATGESGAVSVSLWGWE